MLWGKGCQWDCIGKQVTIILVSWRGCNRILPLLSLKLLFLCSHHWLSLWTVLCFSWGAFSSTAAKPPPQTNSSSLLQEWMLVFSNTSLFFVLILIQAGFVFHIVKYGSSFSSGSSTYVFFGYRRQLGNWWIHCWYGQYSFEVIHVLCSIYGSIWAAVATRNYHLSWAIRSIYIMVCFSIKKNQKSCDKS